MGKGGAPEAAEPDSITVRVPISFRKRGGRKTVIAPNGAQRLPALQSKADTALIRALARAFRWRKLIETGVYSTIREIAKAEQMNDSFVCRVLRLSLLSPEVVQWILNEKPMSIKKIAILTKKIPDDWQAQRKFFEDALRPLRRVGFIQTS